jgi:hypothetical protein
MSLLHVTEIYKFIILPTVVFRSETASHIKGITQTEGAWDEPADEYIQDKRVQISRG